MDIIEILKVIFLGIVEGITEWLPISSTGHMILVDEFIKLNVSNAFMQMFLVVIQLGAILAVVVIYFKKLWPFVYRKEVHMPYEQVTFKDYFLYVWYKFCDEEKFMLWFKIAFACIPAMAVGLFFDDFIEAHFNTWYVVSAMLIIYGILFILIETKFKARPKYNTLNELTFKTAFLIGIFQMMAVIPGTSRSGATILGGMLVGTSRLVATEFTFFLAIPVMFGASLLKVLKFGFTFTSAELMTLGIGMSVAFVVSILAIKFLVGYLKKNDFKAFGIYRIILGLAVFAYFGMQMF